jgi:hypothetical protein
VTVAGAWRALQAGAAVRVLEVHTSPTGGSSFEIPVPVPFLKPGAFPVQGATRRHDPPQGAGPAQVGYSAAAGFEKVINGLMRRLRHFPGG